MGRELDVVELDVPIKKRKIDFRGRGKQLDSAWESFRVGQGRFAGKAICNYCNADVSRKVERLRSHLQKCKMVPKPSVSGQQSVPEVVVEDNPPTTKIPLQSKQATLKNYFDTLTKSAQQQMQMEIGKYIYAMNLPFNHVEHPAFEKLLKQLRPACNIPCRQTVGGSLLDKAYIEITQERDKEIYGKNVTILQDGWKTRTSEPVIAHSVICNGKSYFLGAISTEHHKKTSKYCAELLFEEIRKLEEVGAKVIGVVTDNCKSMEKMREMIAQKFPNISTYGCHPHLLNLLGKKLTPEDVISKVEKVHIYFRNHDAARGILNQTKAGRPIISSNVRWNSWQDAFEYYIKNHTKLLETSRTRAAEVNDEDVIDILNNGSFYAQVEKTVEYMKPIQVAIDLLQRQSSTLADGVKQWLILKDVLNIRDPEHVQYFNKQFQRALQPVSIAAYMLHPKYRGEDLAPELLEIGNKFLAAESPMYVVLAAQLRAQNTDIYSLEMFSEEVLTKCRPVDWWTSMRDLEKVGKDLIAFASRLMQLPAGSAEIERHFSTLGNIINVRRSKLGVDKASKLCVLYKHFNSSGDSFDCLDLDK